MENKMKMNDSESFLRFSQQQDSQQRMERFFVQAAGEEDISRREACVKYFDMGANRYQAVVFPEAVHFRGSGGGPWQEIDNTLEEAVTAEGRHVLSNRANRIRVELPVELDGGDMLSIEDDGCTLSWRFERETQSVRAGVRTGTQLKKERLAKLARTMPKYAGRTMESLLAADLESEMQTEQEKRGDIAALSAQAQYEDALPGVTVRYTLSGEAIKEDIILANAGALASAAIRLPKRFDYTVSEDGQLHVLDAGEEHFRVSAPVVYDAEGKTAPARVILTDCGEYVRLEYALDEDFLREAVYPVTIDPVINSTNALNNIQDTTLGEGQSATPHQEDHLKIGKFGGVVQCVGLLKFNALAIPKPCDTVISAVLMMRPKSCSTSNYIGAYEVEKFWQAATANWLNFNPNDTANISPYAQECVQGASSGTLQFDLTNLYRKWCTRNAAGASNNNGVAFRTPANISGNNYCELYSANAAAAANRPVMYVSYVSHAGLESWWQYEQMSADRAGTAYADLFNGNLVLAHSDTVMTGNRNPVSVSHYYNSCRATENDFGCGYGWKTDAHQRVTALTWSGTNYYIWEDGDGTQHFFRYTGGSGPFKDEEGMELELRINTASMQITITDKMNNVMTFKIIQAGLAWLESTKDACGNTSTYTYVSGKEAEGRLDKVTDPVGRVTQFSYDSAGLLSSIRVPAAESNTYDYVYYTYDSAKRLTGIRYSAIGGTSPQTTYAYEGTANLLTSARYYDGKQVNIAYEPTSLYDTTETDNARRVLSMETVATSNTGAVTKRGAKEIFDYGTMVTNVTVVSDTASDAGKKLYYQFNDAGNVTCVRDELGFASFTKYASGIENTPSEESRLYRAVVNRLRRPDLSAQWTASQSGGTASIDASNLCLNCKSVKMSKTGAGETSYWQKVDIEKNQSFTFSAYVKTDSLSGGGAFLRIRNSAGTALVSGSILTGSTQPPLGNGLPTDGWERVSVTLPARSTDTSIYAELVCTATSGTAWFACPQLETGVVANAFNLVSNGDFRYTAASGAQTLPLDWDQGANNLTTASTGAFPASSDPNFPSALQGGYVQVEGRPDKTLMGFVQYFDMQGSGGDIFVVGGWADGKSIPNADTRDRGFTLALSLKRKSDGQWINPAVYPFNDEWVNWQQNCYATAAGADYTQIALYILYTGNCNTAKFTNIFLHREAYGTSFGYDSKGNVLSVSNLAGQKSEATYDSANNMQTYVQPGRDNTSQNQYWAYYGATDADRQKHLPWRTRTPMNLTDYFSYDAYGNTTSSRRVDYRVFTGNTAESAYPYIRTETTYAHSGNYAATTKDARGNVVSQQTNGNTGTLTSVTDPNDQTVNYTYDALNRVTKVETASDGKTYQNGYTYDYDRIKTVSHNTTSNTVNDVTYTFDYDALGRKTTVKVGTQELSKNVYEDNRSGLLKEVDYGNGGKVKYTYDGFDRLTGVKYDAETTDRYEYKYGANGQAAEVVDNNLNRTAKTFYDLANRPSETELRDDVTNSSLYQTHLWYDKLNNLQEFTENVEGVRHTSKYAYDRDNRITSITYDGDDTNKASYTYDELGRVATRTVSGQTSTYSYVSGGYGTNSTTPLVSKISQPQIPFEYTYDNRGNIISEKRGTQTTTYVYDALGQLIRVNDPNEDATWVYNYDRGGNILSKVKYAYTTGALGTAQETIPYVYGDSNWKDKLTSYNGQTITYDAIGNPLNDGIWTYEWQAGRQLQRMSVEGMAVSFKYDYNGLRTQKIVEQDWYPVTTNYTLHGKLITHMNVNYYDWDEVEHNDELHFFYDAQSRPAMVEFNGELYTYVHNLQGDIIGILDSLGNLMVEYKYDAWGKLLSTTGSLADTLGKYNPFRYRGYVYDEETGLYCLKDRYYHPELQRFINSDITLGSPGMLLASNAYLYCWNNPANAVDSTGEWPDWGNVFAAVAAAVVATVIVVAAAPAAICAASFTLAYYGVSMATATAVATAGVAAAGTFAISGYYSDAIETVTGTNPIRDVVFSGNPQKYETYRTANRFALASVMQMSTRSPGVCFTAGTLVSTEDGLVPIEEIRVGQMVWAEDPETGECALKRVVRTFLNESDELVHVRVNGETITCTTEHPFYVQGKGWVAAKDLKPKDKLTLQSGKTGFVLSICREKLSNAVRVYNFEVEEFHTYFVGSDCVLVHNVCETDKVAKELGYSRTKKFSHGQRIYMNTKAKRMFRYIARDIDSHNGGYWKAAEKVEDLYIKTTRSGTYDIHLNWIKE